MTDAEHSAQTTPAEILTVLPELERIAASGGSEAVYQHDCPDGSTLLVRVRSGEPPVYEPQPLPDQDAA